MLSLPFPIGTVTTVFKGHQGQLRCVVLAQDVGQVVSAAEGCAILLWLAASGVPHPPPSIPSAQHSLVLAAVHSLVQFAKFRVRDFWEALLLFPSLEDNTPTVQPRAFPSRRPSPPAIRNEVPPRHKRCDLPRRFQDSGRRWARCSPCVEIKRCGCLKAMFAHQKSGFPFSNFTIVFAGKIGS